jgi:hypothetical protein
MYNTTHHLWHVWSLILETRTLIGDVCTRYWIAEMLHQGKYIPDGRNAQICGSVAEKLTLSRTIKPPTSKARLR